LKQLHFNFIARFPANQIFMEITTCFYFALHFHLFHSGFLTPKGRIKSIYSTAQNTDTNLNSLGTGLKICIGV
jgi:hypothetical protein